jgi:hypothetical protein
MPTARKIADIKSNLLRPALTSHFEVEIGLPNDAAEFRRFLGLNEVPYSITDQTRLQLMCSEATLPGSNIATFDINDNFHGVTERHAYRRIYDDRIDLTFYVDAENYLPIRFFETWIKYIVDESRAKRNGVGSEDPNYFYRVRYPEGTGGYTAKGLKVIKFERDYKQKLEYEFIKSFPISITSMPISYDSSSLLKCTVSMTYIRYVLIQGSNKAETPPQPNLNLTPEQLARINSIPFNSNANLGVAPLTTGGVPLPSSQASGNNVSRAFSGVSLL